jgi:uncharacterized membrane protein
MNLRKLRLRPRSVTWQRALPYVLLIGGIIGMLASFMLTYDKIHVLQNPDYRPACNINPILSCGSVMQTEQATLLGVPNTIFGLVAFSMLTTFAVLLLAGAQVKRWVWQAAQVAATGGVIFMHYLFFEAVWRIHAICPWCFVVWMITIPIFYGITIYNLRQGNLGHLRWKTTNKVGLFIEKYSNDLLVLWYLIILGILLVKFWYYWSTLL